MEVVVGGVGELGVVLLAALHAVHSGGEVEEGGHQAPAVEQPRHSQQTHTLDSDRQVRRATEVRRREVNIY